jgi:hypothetical protein
VPVRVAAYDSFDQAFMLATGKLKFLDSFDAAFLVLKGINKGSRDYMLWGPEARLMANILTQQFATSYGTLIAHFQSQFDMSGDISVNLPGAEKALQELMKAAEGFWDVVKDRVRDILSATISRARDHVIAMRDPDMQVLVAEKAAGDDILEQALAKSAAAIDQFKSEFYWPEFQRLMDNVSMKPDMRTIDRIDLARQIDDMRLSINDHLVQISDLTVGRLWNYSSLQMMYRDEVVQFMSLAEHDSKTCDECALLDGKVFDVGPSLQALADYHAEETFEIPFVRYDDIDNVSMEALQDKGLAPPYHPYCRCSIVPIHKRTAAGLRTVVPAPMPAMPSIPQTGSPFSRNVIESLARRDKDSINETYVAQIKDDGSGIAKSVVEEKQNLAYFYADAMRVTKTDLEALSMADREVLSYEVDKMLGEGFIPETVMKNYAGKGEMSVQEFVPDFKQLHKINLSTVKRTLMNDQERTAEASAFDRLLGSCDRHSGNVGFDRAGNIVFIDNGYSFALRPERAWNGDFYHCTLERMFWIGKGPKEIVPDYLYEQAAQKIGTKALEMKAEISQLFEKAGLPEAEQKAFWQRARQLKKHTGGGAW